MSFNDRKTKLAGPDNARLLGARANIEPNEVELLSMNTPLILAGAACTVGAVVGGGVTILGVTIPKILSVPRQAMLGVLGVLLMGISFFLPVDVPSDDSEAYKSAEGAIDSPKKDQVVSPSFDASGTASHIGKGVTLWLLEKVENNYYPKAGHITVANTAWKQPVLEQGKATDLELSLWAANRAADAQLSDWMNTCNRKSDCPAFSLPTGMNLLTQPSGTHLTVKR
jgi:hypothetical protein